MTGAMIFVAVVAFGIGAAWAAAVIVLGLTKRKR